VKSSIIASMLISTTLPNTRETSDSRMTNPANLEEVRRAPIAAVKPLGKGLGFLDGEMPADEIAGLRWNLLHQDLTLPTAVLYEDKLAHNLAWMQKFADVYGAKLAPHGKTTMAPKLWHRQLQAGAWGITLATVHQTRVAYEYGVRRVLMANQLVGRENMMTISRLLEDPGFEFFCLVDSEELVEALGRLFSSRKQQLNVLLEVGVLGGRTGIRNRQQMQALLRALNSCKDHVVLCGVELFEGLLSDEKLIRGFVENTIDVTNELAQRGSFQRSPIILSGAGSAWFDVVADLFKNAQFSADIEILLRSGCYLTHDTGVYRDAQARMMKENPVAQKMAPGLTPALQLWAYVQSIPEKNAAIVGLGKRDAPFDAGLPIPALHFRPGQERPLPAPKDWKVMRLWDQHAYMQIPDTADLAIGDMLGFDISHPCLTFDKWRYLLVVNSRFDVIDLVETFF
jgi:D-serine deaminase-like pyridoxal phosphate-dependent protein